MKVTVKERPKTHKFGDVEEGDLFRHNKVVYMKTSQSGSNNAVRLDNGFLSIWTKGTSITPVEAVFIEEKE